jgi:NADH-quinone oxidoreductase subunit L
MRLPLYVLVIPATLGGLVVAYPAAVLGPAHTADLFHGTTAAVMTALVLVTGALVLVAWRRDADFWHPHPLPHPPVDTVYDVGLVRPVRWLASVVRAGDRDVIESYVEAAGWSTGALGRVLRLAQTGNVQTYLMVVVVGAAAVAVAAGAMS